MERERTFTWRFFAALVVPVVLLLGRFRFRHAERIPAITSWMEASFSR